MKLSQHVARTGLAISAASAVAFTTSADAQAAPASHTPAAAPMYANCLDPAPPNKDPRVGNSPGSIVRLRTGIGTNCAIVGQTPMGQNLDLYCYTDGPDGYHWTYAKDLTTGIGGWFRDDAVNGGGSLVWCGF